MFRIIAAGCLLLGFAASARAGSASTNCVANQNSVSCEMQMYNIPSGDPVYVVSVNVVRSVANARTTARVIATDCNTRIEPRSSTPLGGGSGGTLTSFNWPTALETAWRRCVQVHLEQCSRLTGEVVPCISVINAAQTSATVRW
jgi:hypothetical protein